MAALNATLPGIDANDEPKTLAVFRFYCMLLSSVGNLPVRLCHRLHVFEHLLHTTVHTYKQDGHLFDCSVPHSAWISKCGRLKEIQPARFK